MLILKDICKTYKSKKGTNCQALKNINITFPDSGMVFVLGKSGSGKSTLLNVIGGLDAPDSGEIIVKGKSSKHFTTKDYDSYRNTYLGFIFQEYNVMDDFSVADNIALALKLQNQKATKKVIDNILNQVGLEEYAKRKPNELSGGQKQRVAIARALVKDPEIIFGDEPTGNLDSNTSKQIFDLLKELSKNKLIVIVSHDRENAEKYADRIIELADGNVISDVSRVEDDGKDFEIKGNQIYLPKNRSLTKREVSKVNKAIKESSGKAKIRQRDDSVFTPTTDTKNTKRDGFRLIKSRFPNRYASQIAVSNFKTKKFRLVVTIFLTVISLALFGLSQIFANYDIAKASSGSFHRNDINKIVLKQGEYNKDLDTFLRGNQVTYDTLPQKNYKKLTKVKGDFEFYEYYGLNSMVSANMDTSLMSMLMAMIGRNLTTPYTNTIGGNIIISEQDAAKYLALEGQENIQFEFGSYPQLGQNSVAITDYLADVIIKKNYKSLNDSMQDDTTWTGDKTSDTALYEYLLYKGFDDALGLHYNISGIIITNYDIIFKDLIDTYNLDPTATTVFTTHKDYEVFADIVNNIYSVVYTPDTTFIDHTTQNGSFAQIERFKFRPALGEYNKKAYTMAGYVFSMDELLNMDGVDADELISEKAISADAINLLKTVENAIVLPVTTYDELFKTKTNDSVDNFVYYADNADKKAEFNTVAFGNYKILDMKDGPAQEKFLNVVGVVDFDELVKLVPDAKMYGSAVTMIADDNYLLEIKQENYALKGLYTILSDNENANERLLRTADDLYMYHVSELSETLYMVANIFKIFSIVFRWVALILGIFSVILLFNFVSLSVVNKQKDIGILRAIGAKGSDVSKIFLIESAIMGAITVVFSWALIFVGTSLVNSLLVGSFKSFLQSTVIEKITLLSAGIVPLGAVLLACIVVVFLATIIPTIRISRMKPVDAIKKIS